MRYTRIVSPSYIVIAGLWILEWAGLGLRLS